MWHDLLVALALLMVIEGILPFINPEGMRKTLILFAQMDNAKMRFIGLTSMLIGIVLLYIVN